QQQRLCIARAIAVSPEILLMDEPYGALDHLTRERMQDWLLSVWQQMRKTVLFVTHYIEEAVFLADRIVVLRDSHFVKDIEVPFERPRTEDVRYREQFLSVKHEVLDQMGGLHPSAGAEPR
ncbi:MAG: ABC transporter ATP-binding protein, partial [Acidobacteria bacterium]|nr:ABC transporter ATP-binding protein [Acidobacteriota bacterium]